MRADPITIGPYDPLWPASFERERSRVEAVVRPWLDAPVAHIGSTSVPGLAAKPIIDMLALATSYEDFAAAVPLLEGIGWVAAPEPGDAETRRYSLCFPTVAYRTHHLHVVEAASEDWRDWILFRDFLREHPEDAAAYGRLKAGLADQDPRDRPRYRAAKAPFIVGVLGRAREGRSERMTGIEPA